MKPEKLPKGLEKYTPAVKALQKFILEQEKDCDPKLQCRVYCWGSEKDGIRVAEISYWLPKGKNGCGAGSSFMRSTPECGNVILAAEDFLLTFFDKPYRPEGWESDIDEHADAKWKLEQALKFEEEGGAK
jgi:hypothetical protein